MLPKHIKVVFKIDSDFKSPVGCELECIIGGAFTPEEISYYYTQIVESFIDQFSKAVVEATGKAKVIQLPNFKMN